MDVEAFESAGAFEDWLERNHRESGGLWLKIAKKGADEQTVTYAQAVDAALCFGWIDGQKQRLDDSYWLQRFTPRSPRSRWSKINREKAERLIAAGRMREEGQAEVDRARADGRWDAAYEGSRTATVPEDLQRELDADPVAAAAFASLDARTRYSIIWRINDAKRPATRARRIETYLRHIRRSTRV